MPQTIAYIIWAYTPAFVTQAVATAIANAIVAAAISYGVSKYEQGQLKDNQKRAPLEVIARDTTQPQVLVYGHCFVGGLIGYINTNHPGTDQGHELHMLVVVAGHEVEDITDIYLDDTLLDAGGDLDWSSNAVVAGDYDPDSRTDKEAVKVWKYLGTSTQAAAAELIEHYPGDWETTSPSSHRLRGLAYVVFRFKLTTKSEKLWAGGPPQSIRIKVKGKKVYDPRLDTSPGANPTNPSYIAWSDNSVLCAADYMRSFMNIDAARFDWSWIADQADVCDVLVPIPPAASPTNYEKRYTCNGALSLGETHGNNIQTILSSCMGRLSKVNGKWRITAGAYETPTITLTDDDLVGTAVMSTSLSRTERFNTVRGLYGEDPSNRHREMEFRQVTSASLVARDNGETIVRSLSLPMTTSEYMAQRIAYKILLQGNQQTVITLPVRWTGLKVAVGSGVQLTLSKFGWTNKVFRCIGWKLGGGDAPLELVLKEDNSSAWSDPGVADYTTVTAAGVVVVPDTSALPVLRVPLINVMPAGYSDFETLPINFYTAALGSVAYDTTYFVIGQQSLKVTGVTGNGSTWGVALEKASADPTMFLRANRRWLFVGWFRVNQYVASIKMNLQEFDGTNNYSATGIPSADDTWEQLAFEIDLTSNNATWFSPIIHTTNPGLALGTPIYWVDALMMFDVTDTPFITTANWYEYIRGFLPATGSLTPYASSTFQGQVRMASTSESSGLTATNVAMSPADVGSALATIGAPQCKVKTATESRSSANTGNTLTDDSDLSGFTIKANTAYVLKAFLRLSTASANGDIQWAFQYSQTPQDDGGWVVEGDISNGNIETITSVNDLTAAYTYAFSANKNFYVQINAYILGHATLDGTLDFQWAQVSSHADAATNWRGSWIELTPVG